MSTTIGEVNINLRMSLANFKRDVQDGTDAARNGTKRMADDMKTSTFEARGTLSLLGEEIGVRIPRHLQTMISNIPGVGTALSAAFSSVAVLALIEVFVKIIEKIAEFKKKAEEAAEALRKSGEVGQDALHKLQEEILGLDAQLAEMNGNYLAAFLDKLKLIDEQNLDALVAEFQKIGAAADDALSKIQSGFLDTLSTFGKNHRELLGVKQDLDATVEHVQELQRAGERVAIGFALEGALKRVNFQLQDSAKLTDDVVQALELERDRLQDMQKVYERNNQLVTKQKELEKEKFDNAEEQRLQAEIKSREALTGKVNELTNATHVLLEGERSQADVAIEKAQAVLNKLRELDAERQAEFPGIKTYYGTQISALQEKLSLMKKEQEQQEALFAKGIIPGAQFKLPEFKAPPLPIFTGTSQSLELEKIKTDSAATQAEVKKVIDGIQTENDKFREQVAILDELKRQGLLTGAEYQKAFKQAEAASQKVTGEWKRLGNEMGANISAAISFQQSWSSALKNILADLLKVIIQMELMKALGKSGIGGGGGGIGGFLGAVFGGFRAAGGPVDSSHAYLVGEHGPEWFTPKGAGDIVPHGKTPATHVSYTHNQYVTTPDADSFQKSSSQMAADAYERMAASHARNR